ncbi:MAG: YolD-like family protein [Tissierellia bacterium]|nr:YolD-like family protein [Tissierellia bacterium]
MKKPYDDIINLPHHRSTSRPPMSAHDRAAQFSPFAALTGYGSAITERARLTDSRVELDECSKVDLNEKLIMIQNQIDQQPEVSITYFHPDKRKSGGAYITVTGFVKKIDEYERTVAMQDATIIPVDAIIEIDGELLGTSEHEE